MQKNKKRDFRKAINKTQRWGKLRKVFKDRKYKLIFLSPFLNDEGYQKEAWKLTHPLAYMPQTFERRWNKAVKKHNNGGGERAFRGMRKTMSKREITENIGKSSRKYSRMKEEWWNHGEENY